MSGEILQKTRPAGHRPALQGTCPCVTLLRNATLVGEFGKRGAFLRRSRPFAFLRDRLLSLTSLEQVVGPIVKQLTEPL